MEFTKVEKQVLIGLRHTEMEKPADEKTLIPCYRTVIRPPIVGPSKSL